MKNVAAYQEDSRKFPLPLNLRTNDARQATDFSSYSPEDIPFQFHCERVLCGGDCMNSLSVL
jgi:hypothetical protein